MADDLTVKSPGAGAAATARVPSEEAAADPEEKKFQTFAESARKRGVNVPEANLRRIFAFGEARVAKQGQKVDSSRAHYAKNETESLDAGGVGRQAKAAELTGAAQVRSVATGLTPEDERQVSGGKLGATPHLPPPGSAPITPEETREFLGNLFRNRVVNGEPQDLESVLARGDASKSAPAPRPKTGVVRAGSGKAALSMKLGAGGANLVGGSSASPSSSSSGSSHYGSGRIGYNWPNVESSLIEFMMLDEKNFLDMRKSMKKLRMAEAKSSQQGRKLDIAVTRMNQLFEKAKANTGAVKSGEQAAQGIVQAWADGVTGKLSDEDPMTSVTDQSKLLENLRTKMADITDQVVKPGEDPAATGNLDDMPRTVLTKKELDKLRIDQPKQAKEYDKAFKKFSDLKANHMLGALKHNQALVPEEQRADFDEQINAAQDRVTKRSKRAFSNYRGFGMLDSNRAQQYNQVHKTTAKIDQATAALKDLKTGLAKAEGENNPEAVQKLKGDIRTKEKQIGKLKGEKIELLHAVVELDKRLAVCRPLADSHIASQETHQKDAPEADEKATREIGKQKESITKAKEDIATLKKEGEGLNKGSDKKKLAKNENKIKKLEQGIETSEKQIEKLEKDIKDRPDVLKYEGTLFKAMFNRRFEEDPADKVTTPDDEPSGEGGIVITEGDEPLEESGDDLDKRLLELEVRAKAGEQFLSEKSGTYDINWERKVDMVGSRLESEMGKLAGVFQGSARKFIQGTISHSAENSKSAGAMIQRTQSMTDRLLESLARMRR